MAIDKTRIKKHIIDLIGANERNDDGSPKYSAVSGDEGVLIEAVDTALTYALRDIMKTVCQTDGHENRGEFVADAPVTHGQPLPAHYGSIGIPKITPYEDADFTITGVRKSAEEIDSYRRTLTVKGFGELFEVPHDQADEDNEPSELAGFYAQVTGDFYFSGFSCVVPMANFADSDYTKLLDSFEPVAMKRVFGYLRKDGMISDIFGDYWNQSEADLREIRGGAVEVPSFKPTVGMRDVGTK